MSVAKTDLEASSGSERHSTELAPSTPENKEALPSQEDEFPDGGLKAWLTVAGGASIFFCCLGFNNSFGTFEAYYLKNQLKNESPDTIAWIGSVSAFLPFVTGLLGGPLFDRYGAWVRSFYTRAHTHFYRIIFQQHRLIITQVVRPATVLYIFAMMMLSLCKTYWQIMLVQGVLMGIAMAFLQFPAFAAASQYFKKKRAAALGVMVAGSSIGGIVMPIILSKMLNNSSLGFGWSVRVVGFLIMPFMLFACVSVTPRLPPRKNKFWLMAAYKNRNFVVFCASFFFILVGMFTPIFFLPSFAIKNGMDATLAGYLPAILNAASTFGRVIPGVMADKYGPINIFGIGGLMTGIVIFCFDEARSNAALIVYAIVFGFVSGTIISGASAAISIFAKDARDIGTYMGMGMALSSFGVLIGPPINGAFIKAFDSYFQLAMFSGAMCVFS